MGRMRRPAQTVKTIGFHCRSAAGATTRYWAGGLSARPIPWRSSWLRFYKAATFYNVTHAACWKTMKMKMKLNSHLTGQSGANCNCIFISTHSYTLLCEYGVVVIAGVVLVVSKSVPVCPSLSESVPVCLSPSQSFSATSIFRSS